MSLRMRGHYINYVFKIKMNLKWKNSNWIQIFQNTNLYII